MKSAPKIVSDWWLKLIPQPDSAGFHLGGPDREAAGFEEGLDVPAEVMGLSGVPGVDLFAFHAGGLGAAPVGVEDLAVQDQMRDALIQGSLQGLVEVEGAVGEDVDDLVQVPVGGGLGDPERFAVPGDVRPVPEPRDREQGLTQDSATTVQDCQ